MAGIDRDGLRVGGVLRLGSEFNKLAAQAGGHFEAPRGAAFVGIVSADDSEGECGKCQFFTTQALRTSRASTKSLFANADFAAFRHCFSLKPGAACKVFCRSISRFSNSS